MTGCLYCCLIKLAVTNRQIEIISRKEQSKKTIPSKIAWYLVGFADGEGSFNVSLRKKRDYKIGWQPVLSFNVSQREKTILALMKKYFRCGIIKRHKDGLYSYDVTNPKDIIGIIMPFFRRYNFLSENKRYNFSIFSKITELMVKKKHLEPEGFKQILELRDFRIKREAEFRKRKETKVHH